MFPDLQSFLRALEASGDLVRIDAPAPLRYGVAAGIRRSSSIGGPALLFENLIDDRTGDERPTPSIPVAGGVYAHRRRVLSALGVTEREFFPEYLRRLGAPIEPTVVTVAPVQEVVLTGDDVDLFSLPVPIHSRDDGGPYVMMGLQFAQDPEYGPNVAVARMQLHTRNEATLFFGAHQHLGIYFARAREAGRPLPVATVIGSDPYLMLASQTPGHVTENEVALAGGLAGQAIETVRCRTIDVAVPARAEIVIEGHLLPDATRWEGPFGDMSGYYSPASDRPVYRITAITHRRSPVYLTGLAGLPMADNHVLRAMNYEAFTWEHLRHRHPTIQDVCWTEGGAGTMHIAISMTPRYEGEAKEVALAAFEQDRIRAKLVTVVDADIDVRDPRQVEWAMAFRMQGDRDITIMPDRTGSLLDPSAPRPRVWTQVAIDATRPWGVDWPEIATIPGSDTFEIPGWTAPDR